MDIQSPAHAAFGAAIRALRKQRGISQEAFAPLCELDRSYYGGVERGERNPSLSNILKITRALGVMPSELLARAEQIDKTAFARRTRRPPA